MSAQTLTSGHIKVELKTDPVSIVTGRSTTLDVLITDSMSSLPPKGLIVTASLMMPSMAGMILKQPTVSLTDLPGLYRVNAMFPDPGDYLLDLHVKTGSEKSVSMALKITPGKASKVDMQGLPPLAKRLHLSASRLFLHAF
ncbi:MAG: FixH family protein [Chthonomonadales bacterium]